MYSTRVIIVLLVLAILLLGTFVFVLLFHIGDEDTQRETVREEMFVNIAPEPPEAANEPVVEPVSQPSLEAPRALGTDVNMEFPTIDAGMLE
jgi:hypothetical protein